MAILDDQAYLILEKEEDICLFLGNTDERYYSTIWKRQQKQSLKISFNGAAFLCGPLWLVYRKMIFLALGFTYTFAFALFLQPCFNFDPIILLFGVILFFIYLGLFGNWHYYIYVQKEILSMSCRPDQLPKTELGKTGMRVTRLGFGSMGLRGHRTWGVRVVDDAAAGKVLNPGLDDGLKFIDTAPEA